MKPRALPLACSLLLAVVLPACQGKTTPTKQAAADQGAPAPTATKTPSPAADGPAADDEGADGPTDDGSAAAGPSEAKAPPAAPADPKGLGAHRADPGWFRKTLFGDKGKALDTKRSQADEQGRFSSMIRFELTDMTLDACAQTLEDKVKPEVTNLERKEAPQGRIQLKGSTDRFTVTFMCGTAEGKTIAYVSYAWT